MARINWEDSIYTHPMYPKLLLKIGCEYKTKGLLLTAFELAQKYWLDHRAVPASKWPSDMNVLVEFNFAEIQQRDDGVYFYVAGSKEHCAFKDAKSEAGKKGGKSRSAAKLKNLKQNVEKPKKARNTTEAQPKQDRNEINQTEASYSYSFSNSISNSFSDSSTDSVNASHEQKTKSFIAGYCDRFKFKYGTYPEMQGKPSGLAKTISKGLSDEKIDLYLDAFFAMPDAMVVKAKHPLSLFQLKLNEIVVFANTGNFTTQRQAMQADDMASNHLLLQKVRKAAT